MNTQQLKAIFVSLLLELIAGSEVDIYLPSFPELQTIWNLSQYEVELTLAMNLAAQFLATLFVGNLGDKYGTKRVLIAGLVLFILGSVICVFAGGLYSLLVGRVIQGIGIAGPTVLAFLLIADVFELDEQKKIMGLLSGMITFGMALGPIVGSQIAMHFHWYGSFVVLSLLGVLALILTFYLIPSDKTKDNDVSYSLKEYVPLLMNRKTILYIASIVSMILPFWIYVGLSPIILMNYYNVNLIHYGYFQASIVFSFGIVSLLSPLIQSRIGEEKCLNYSFNLLKICFVLFLLVSLFRLDNPYSVTLLFILNSIAIVFPINIFYPLALAEIPGTRARMSSLISAFRLIVSAISIQTLSYFYDGSFIFVGLACAIIIITMLSCANLVRRSS